MAVGDAARQRRGRVPAGLPRHAATGAPAAVGLPPALRRHRRLRRPDHVLDDAGRAAPDARRGAGRTRRGLRGGQRRGGIRRRRGGHEPRPPGAADGMSAVVLLAAGVLGGLGAAGRFLLDGAVSARTAGRFPYGTLAVNLSGAFVLGALVGAALDGDAYRILGTGLIGGYTTFSTWALESHRLGGGGELRLGAANFAGALVLRGAAGWVRGPPGGAPGPRAGARPPPPSAGARGRAGRSL